MGHCHSRPRCHSAYSYYSHGCEPCHPCEPPRMMHGCNPCHCHTPQIIMYDPGQGYGRKNVQQQMCQCGGYIPQNRIPTYYPQASQMPPYPPTPVNPGNYAQPQQTPYPSPQQQHPIPRNNYSQVQQPISKTQSSQPRSSSPPPPYS